MQTPGVRLITIVLVLFATACGSGSDEAETESPSDGTWLSRMPGTDAWLGLTLKDGQSAAFVCGGEDTLDSHTRWMKTELNGSELRFKKDGWQLNLDFASGDFEGALVDPTDEALDVVATKTDDTGLVGLYFSFDSGCADGTIVIRAPAKDNVDAQGVWCDAAGNRSQVTPVLPVNLDGPDLKVTAPSPDGEVEFTMQPALPTTVRE